MIYKYAVFCLMALFTLFVIHLLIIKSNYAEVTALSASKKWAYSDPSSHNSLYTASDKVALLTVDNFNENVYNSTSAWIVQFYNSWCGHCIKFSPVWKQLAADIYNWRGVVTISGIDCADDQNTQHCRDYEIMGYPTIRYFKPMITNFTLGEEFIRTRDEVSELRNNILINLEATEKQIRSIPKNWPNLLPLSSPNSMWIGINNSVIVLVIEKNDSFVGRNLIMDMKDVANVSTRRILNINYEYTSSLPEVKIETKNRSFHIAPGTITTENRQKLFYSIRDILKTKNYTVFDVFVDNHINNEQRQTVKQSSKQQLLVNSVFESDLESALSYSLFHEVALKSTIANDELIALMKYLRVISKYFPFDYEGYSFIQNVVEDVSKFNKLTGGQFKDILQKHSKNTQLKSREWMSCKGSVSIYRGYPCGLWMMFHTLTVKAYMSITNSEAENTEVLDAMTGYVTYFFGCQDCSEHFQQMSKTIPGNVTSLKNSVLWLWRTHNNVNNRLAGDGSEDPSFPKIQFPSESMCLKCRNADNSWNEENVLSYLIKMYKDVHRDKKKEIVFVGRLLGKKKEHDWYFNLFDMNIYIALYILSAFLLTIYTGWFFLNGSLLSRHHKYDFSNKV